MPKVYVTQEQTKLNYLPAEKYGEIRFITRDEFSPVAGSLSNRHLMGDIWHHLEEFDNEVDFLVFSGSPIVAAAVFAVMGRLGFDAFRVLRWSNRDNVYAPITIDIAKRDSL